jgi:uncharacterized membrane protein YjjP (DUF1212 family)
MECGCSSNRVELLTRLLGESLGFEVETLAIPTGVWISVRRDQTNLLELTRVRSWSVDLDKLVRLNDLVDWVHDHRLTIGEASARLREIDRAEPPYGRALTLLAGGVAPCILIFAYGGTGLEALLGLPIGVAVQWLAKYTFAKSESRQHIGDFLCAAVVSLYAHACHWLLPAIDVPRLIVGGIVILVPGLVTVNAVHEVAQKNLVSGAAKLLEALMITASLGCGVVFVLVLVHLVR